MCASSCSAAATTKPYLNSDSAAWRARDTREARGSRACMGMASDRSDLRPLEHSSKAREKIPWISLSFNQ